MAGCSSNYTLLLFGTIICDTFFCLVKGAKIMGPTGQECVSSKPSGAIGVWRPQAIIADIELV